MKRFALALLVLLFAITSAAAVEEETDLPITLKEDGGRLYAGYETGKIRVLDSENLDLLATIDTKQGWIWSLETDSDNIYFGTAGKKTVSITKDGAPVASANHTDFVLSVFLDREKLYACSRSGMIRIYSTPDLALLGEIDNTGICGSVVVDDARIYAVSQMNKIGVWDKETLRQVGKIQAHDGTIRGVWVDENTIYSVADDDRLKIWNKTDLSQIKAAKQVKKPWTLIGDGSMLYLASEEKILVLDKNGNTIATLNARGPDANDIFAAQTAIYSAHSDGTIRKWDKRTLTNTATSQVFTYRNPIDVSFDKYRLVFYALLAVGVVGYAVTSLREKRKEK